jgi:hypothetical protein
MSSLTMTRPSSKGSDTTSIKLKKLLFATTFDQG